MLSASVSGLVTTLRDVRYVCITERTTETAEGAGPLQRVSGGGSLNLELDESVMERECVGVVGVV